MTKAEVIAWLDTMPDDLDISIHTDNDLWDAIQPQRNWHIGTPTEEGNYWVWCELIEDNCLPKSKRPYVGYWKDNEWWDIYPFTTIRSVLGADIVAWMPITPYQGEKNND